LPQFQAQYPELVVDLLLTDAVVDIFAEHIDVAVRLGQLADSALIAQHLMWTRYRVCASPTYLQKFGVPMRPEEVTEHNCLRFPLPGFRSQWIFKDAAGALTQVFVQGRTVVSNAMALQQCAIADMGLALLADWLTADAVQSGKLVDVFPNYQVTATDFNTAAWLVYPSRTYVPRKAQVFMELLKRAYASENKARQ
jgi:DNA-binding transcriptional LysR family regulator